MLNRKYMKYRLNQLIEYERLEPMPSYLLAGWIKMLKSGDLMCPMLSVYSHNHQKERAKYRNTSYYTWKSICWTELSHHRDVITKRQLKKLIKALEELLQKCQMN